MQRSPALTPLSHDHHRALRAAMALRRATPDTVRQTRDAFLDHWDRDGRVHFRQEEQVLLPAFAAHGDPHHPLVARVLCEHVDIRCRADALVAEPRPPVAALRALGERLHAHVRLEERELFPLIEATLPAPALAALAAALARDEAARG